jgi:ATP-dependent RNA helicase DDX27
MLQGIFEPAAERKRGSLDRIMADFPERRFVLVGDSGEADLEVYTDVVMANPGRVLAVYIRDVTTPDKKFFDQAISNVGPDARTRSNGSRDHYSHSSASDDPEARPSLPERRNALSESGHESTPLPERLNNFEDEPDDLSTEISYHPDLLELQEGDRSAPKPSPPPRPAKPAELRSPPGESGAPSNHDRITSTNAPAGSSPLVAEDRKSPPPKPRRAIKRCPTPSHAGSPPVATCALPFRT